ncbi:Protein FAM219B, partial [Tinamus guttatus]
ERQRELAKAALRRQGLLGGAALHPPKAAAKRSVKFNKGYTALSQTVDEHLVSLDSDSADQASYSAGKVPLCPMVLRVGFRCSPDTLLQLCLLCPFQQVNQDLSRQLLQDGYHLDEVPDDEDLDLIPPKPVASSACPCCFGHSLSCVIQ